MIELTKRMSNGLGGRFSYTYSQLKDNQVGESNFYAAVSPAIPMNNYNYIPSMPPCAAGQQFTTACYDPLANAASACSTCRTASSSRRSSSCRSARASAGRMAASPIC